jgi:Protein of unknown function (DUF3307)
LEIGYFSFEIRHWVMDITLHLILAHFLADYPLQSDRLVAYKSRHFAGILLHSLVHVLTSVLLAFPFVLQSRLWLAIGVVFLTHNILDQTKVWAQRRFPRVNRFLFYVADQVGHLLVIYLSSAWLLRNMIPDFGGAWFGVYRDTALVAFPLVLILATYFYDVSRWTYRNTVKPQPYVRDWKMMGRNAVVVTLFFGLVALAR